MLLTGALTVIAAGSSVQVVVALLIVLIDMLLVLKMAPFVDEADDWLSFLTSFQMLITLLFGLLLQMQALGAQQQSSVGVEYDPSSMGSLLIFINSLGFFALAFSLSLLHPKVRNLVNNLRKAGEKKKKEDEKQARKSTKKIVPSPSEEKDFKSFREWS